MEVVATVSAAFWTINVCVPMVMEACLVRLASNHHAQATLLRDDLLLVALIWPSGGMAPAVLLNLLYFSLRKLEG